MKAGIAEAAVSARSGEVEVGFRYREVAKQQRYLRDLAEIKLLFGNEGKGAKLSRRARFLLYRIATGATVRRWIDHLLRVEPNDSHQHEDKDLNTVADELDEAVKRRMLFSAVRHAVDRNLYSPEYLESNPFYRLDLRGIRAVGNVHGEQISNTGEQIIDVTLFLHKSGVGLLTFSMHYSTAMTWDRLIVATRSDKVAIPRFAVCESIAKNYAKVLGASTQELTGRWLEEQAEGEHWIEFEPTDPNSMADVFTMYHAAIGNFHGDPRSAAWMCHTTISINRLECCRNRAQWIKNHHIDLMAMLAKIPGNSALRTEAIDDEMRHDHSIDDYSSFYLAGGLALEIHWIFSNADREPPTSIDWINRLIVIENGLLQYWQLRATAASLDARHDVERKAMQMQESLIYDLAEYGGLFFVAKTAADISYAVLRQLNGDKIYERLRTRVELLRELLATRHAERSSIRATRLAAAALLGAVIFGLPAIDQALSVFELAFLITMGDEQHARWSLYAYIALILFAFIVMVSRLPSHLRRRRSRRRGSDLVGVAWPGGQIDVTLIQRGFDDYKSTS